MKPCWKARSSLTFICAVDAQANETLIPLISQFQLLSLKPTSKKSLFHNYFQFHPPISSQFLSLSFKSQSQQMLCFQLQAYPSTSSQARASNSPTERNCIATHNSDAPLLFWLRTALRRKFILSLEHVQ